jgi:hypothetical protein
MSTLQGKQANKTAEMFLLSTYKTHSDNHKAK